MTPFAEVNYNNLPAPNFTPEITDKTPFVKECYEKCKATYQSSDPDFASCLLGCTLGGGGQNLYKVHVTFDLIAPMKEARNVKNCESQSVNALFVSYPVYQICVSKCQASRSLKKLLQIIPVPADTGDFSKVCYEKCVAAYGSSGPDFASCLFQCTIGGQKVDVVINPIVPVKVTRDVDDCKKIVFSRLWNITYISIV
jgi:hypothetical protein